MAPEVVAGSYTVGEPLTALVRTCTTYLPVCTWFAGMLQSVAQRWNIVAEVRFPAATLVAKFGPSLTSWL